MFVIIIDMRCFDSAVEQRAPERKHHMMFVICWVFWVLFVGGNWMKTFNIYTYSSLETILTSRQHKILTADMFLRTKIIPIKLGYTNQAWFCASNLREPYFLRPLRLIGKLSWVSQCITREILQIVAGASERLKLLFNSIFSCMGFSIRVLSVKVTYQHFYYLNILLSSSYEIFSLEPLKQNIRWETTC